MENDAPRALRGSARNKWIGALIGAAAGPFDTLLLQWVGVRFEINGSDAGWLIALYFGVSFALLGYLIVAIMEARKRDQFQAALLREQHDVIHQTRMRLAQSEKLAALGQLATMIAHEVRNPLGVMRSSAQEIGDAVGTEGNAGRAASFLIAEIDRLNRVIESILGFAKPVRPRPTTVRVGDLVERAMQLAAEHGKSGRCRLVLDRGPDPEAQVDSDLIVQVVLDLIVNALEASPDGGEVRIAIEAGDGVAVSISDQGKGIASQDRERIFEPFYSTTAGGTGLGLAVSRQIVASHGGTLRAVDAENGARFEIRLPRDLKSIAA